MRTIVMNSYTEGPGTGNITENSKKKKNLLFSHFSSLSPLAHIFIFHSLYVRIERQLS